MGVAAFGVFAYAAFLASVAYFLAAFAMDPLPLTVPVDERTPGPLAVAVAVDLGWLAAFGLQHSLMARASVKRLLVRVVPAEAERSVYVLASSVALAAVAWGFRPVPGTLLQLSSPPARAAVSALALIGLALIVVSAFLYDHAELFGLRQSLGVLRVRDPGAPPVAPPPFRTPSLYKVVRHPMMLGVLMALWATPDLTGTRALFAAGMTAYVLVGVRFEERDLLRTFGDDYARYRERVPGLIPWTGRRR